MYGIYANALLLESTFQRYLKEFSGMPFLHLENAESKLLPFCLLNFSKLNLLFLIVHGNNNYSGLKI